MPCARACACARARVCTRSHRVSHRRQFVPKKNGLNPMLAALQEGRVDDISIAALKPRQVRRRLDDLTRALEQSWLLLECYLTQPASVREDLLWAARTVAEKVKTDQRTKCLELLCLGFYGRDSRLFALAVDDATAPPRVGLCMSSYEDEDCVISYEDMSRTYDDYYEEEEEEEEAAVAAVVEEEEGVVEAVDVLAPSGRSIKEGVVDGASVARRRVVEPLPPAGFVWSDYEALASLPGATEEAVAMRDDDVALADGDGALSCDSDGSDDEEDDADVLLYDAVPATPTDDDDDDDDNDEGAGSRAPLPLLREAFALSFGDADGRFDQSAVGEKVPARRSATNPLSDSPVACHMLHPRPPCPLLAPSFPLPCPAALGALTDSSYCTPPNLTACCCLPLMLSHCCSTAAAPPLLLHLCC